MTSRQRKAHTIVRLYIITGELLPYQGTNTYEEVKKHVSEQLEHLTHQQRVTDLEAMQYRVASTKQGVRNKHERVLTIALMKELLNENSSKIY